MNKKRLKFRRWDITGKKWSFIDLEPNVIGMMVHAFPVYFNYPNKFIWNQYTGLDDVNGNEIYEGDILKANRPSYLPESEGFLVEYKEDEHEQAQWIGYNIHSSMFIGEYAYSVVGNIIEHPELLKK